MSLVMQAGDEIPPPEDIADTEDFREIWRPLVEQQHTTNAEVHIAAPPGLDQVDTLKSEWIQVATKFAHLDIHCPLQALLMDQYFYKDPKGVIQVRGVNSHAAHEMQLGCSGQFISRFW